MTQNPLLISLVFQGLFVAAIGGIKSLVHGKLTWKRFYLGLEISLVALGNGVTNIIDIIREWAGQPLAADSTKTRIIDSVGFIVVAAVALLVVMLIHQRWERDEINGPVPEHWGWRGFWMGIVANGIATASLATFVYFRVKGQL